jgi:hypothetical protein
MQHQRNMKAPKNTTKSKRRKTKSDTSGALIGATHANCHFKPTVPINDVRRGS